MLITNSSQNRLLALDQTLLGWKQSFQCSHEESSPDQTGQTPSLAEPLRVMRSDRQEEPEEIWEDEDDDDDRETIDEYDDEWIANDGAEVYSNVLTPPGRFSYRGLANRLESQAKGLDYSRLRQQMQREEKEAESETDGTLFEPFFFSDSRSATAGNPLNREQQISSTSQFDWQPPIPELAAFSSPDINLPDADFTDAMSSISPGFSEESSSYQSLWQTIQSARQSDRTANDDEAFSSAQTAQTINVEAQAIADFQDDDDDPIEDLPRDPYALLAVPPPIADSPA